MYATFLLLLFKCSLNFFSFLLLHMVFTSKGFPIDEVSVLFSQIPQESLPCPVHR